MRLSRAGLALVVLWALPAAACAAAPCDFDQGRLAFAGTPVEQAACLLRPVARWGKVGTQPAVLPPSLVQLLGTPPPSVAAMQRYLDARGIGPDEVGGPLDRPLSRAQGGSPSAPQATYFVIHDTSTPNFHDGTWPDTIDTPGWNGNRLAPWVDARQPVAHVFVNRVGESRTGHPLDTPWRATKFELRPGAVGMARKGLFLHVENVQPRRRDPAGGPANDALAPSPGFTAPQLERLALLYLVASVRRGVWLVPAFHAVLDLGLSDAHDDPQQFDLARWVERLDTVLAALRSP